MFASDRGYRALFCAAIAYVVIFSSSPANAHASDCNPKNLHPTQDISAETFYTDAVGSVVDQQIVERNRVSLQLLDGAIHQLNLKANAFLAERREADARCAIAMLGVFAKSNAMLGTMHSRQARVERLWRAAGLGVIYFTQQKFAAEADRRLIDPWIKRLAFAVRDDFRQIANNGRYWVGMLVYSVGLATADAELTETGRAYFRDGMNAITAEGLLPEEMRRGQKAIHYHNFALSPLVVTAEIGELSGDKLYEERDGAIHRLAKRVCTAVNDAASFPERAGPQHKVRPHEMLWLAFYARRFPLRLECERGPHNYRSPTLGGNLDLLAQYWLERR
jgi:poly(beta-D-mannuronate) lyase